MVTSNSDIKKQQEMKDLAKHVDSKLKNPGMSNSALMRKMRLLKNWQKDLK